MKSRLPQQRPPAFTYSKGLLRRGPSELHAESVPVAKLAERFGTPLYIYSATTIQTRYTWYDKAFGRQSHTVCYSVKANSNLSILRMLAKAGAGFDIVSGGELQRVLAVNRRAARKAVFSGVGKLPEEIDLALRSGILLFNVESASELELLASRATHLRKHARFAIRVNPDVDAKTHPYISTGLHRHKFGVPLHDANELYAKGTGCKFLDAAAVSVHIGSQITDVEPFRQAMERVASLVTTLRINGHNIHYVDAGGGLGVSYEDPADTSFPKRLASYAQALTEPLKKLRVHLLLEPGRSIVAPAGVLITRVVYRKKNNGKQFVVVDAAMNDLLRPSLYGAYHEIVPVFANLADHDSQTVDVVGPICETGDFFARDRELPPVLEGDLLAILDAGAYGMSLSSNYNTRPRAAEVLVEGKRVRLIRKRETLDQLLAPEWV